MKLIKSFLIAVVALVAASCSSSSKDEPDPNPGFISYDVVDCAITGTVKENLIFGLSWEVTEMTVYRDYKANKDGSLTLVKSVERKETFSPGNCLVKIPKNYTGSTSAGSEVTALPLQMSIETVKFENTSLTFGEPIKMLTEEDLKGSK